MIDDDTENQSNINEMAYANQPIGDVNADAPDFVKDIKRKQSSKSLSNIPLQMNVPYEPTNPYTMDDNAVSYHGNTDIEPPKESSGFLDTVKAEAYDWNNTAKGAHAGYEKFEQVDPSTDIAPSDWNAKTDQENFLNLSPENLSYVLEATGPKDQAQRVQRAYADQAHADTLKNGSFVAKLLGGAIGVVTDPSSYIPIIGWAKYAKLAPTFVKSAMRALPGVAAYSTIQAGADQVDKVNGNMQDFATEAFTNTAFGTALFGTGGAIALTADKLELWNVRKLAQAGFEGVDFKLVTNEKGEVAGFKASDPSGGLSAQKVSFAQDLADSSFAKSGIFKIPYVGTLATHALALKIPGTDFYFGSQLQSLLTSKYNTIRGFVDRVADHTLQTTGIQKGQAAPKKFATMMQQTMAGFRAMAAQMDALHLERNGFDITNRPLGGLVNLGLNLKSKSLSLLSKDMDKDAYVNKDTFYSEVENVLVNETNSEHAPVNDASNMLRKHMNEVYGNYRKAYNLPEDWLPPKTARGYLMRVYDTPYMNANKDKWVSIISNWLSDADDTITHQMEPINTLDAHIKDFEQKHTQAVYILANHGNARIGKEVEQGAAQLTETIPNQELRKGTPEHTLHSMRLKLRALKDQLQDELRENPDLQLHVHDWNALSSKEGKELESLLKPSKKLEADIIAQKAIVAQKKAEASRKMSAAKNEVELEKAQPKAKKAVESKNEVRPEEEKLTALQDKLDKERDRLQDMAHKGEISPRFTTRSKDSFSYEFKDPNDRLRFRDTYTNKEERQGHARAYYDTIMNQTPEDTINQVMGKFTGNGAENPIKQRTLLIPDHVLYDGNFMTKDLMAKVANYTNYLSRRTHLKSVFNDVTTEGGIEPLLHELTNEYQALRTPLDEKKAATIDKKEMAKIDKQLAKEAKDFDSAKKQMNHLYEKMMGIKKYSRGSEQARSIIMSLTSIASLPFVPFTMVNDLGAIGLQHGIWPFIRDGIVPIVSSLNGILKTKNSEALRKTAGSVHLAMQDILNGYADKSWGMYTNPYLNLGRITKGFETAAHMSSNFTLTNYIDNALQRMSGAVSQSEFMRILHAFKDGTMSTRDGNYIRKYGIDLTKWSDRMITAFKANGGGKTKLGGYQSLFHQWQDLGAANEFGDAVFRTIKDTQIQSGIADSPMWSDSLMGSIIKGFNGWMYASVNRYVIPSMQQPDAQKLLGVMLMLGLGSLVDPMRRFARGEDAYPDNITDKQKLWAAINNSGYFSFFATTLADANVLTGDRLLGDLKSDKYKDRTRAGLLGPAWGTFNRLVDIVDAGASGEWNKADMNKASRMLPFANASWTYWMSKKLTDSLNIPDTRAQAHALKEVS